MELSNVFTPTRKKERIQLIDGLRGFALLGIILINIWSFSGLGWLDLDSFSMFSTNKIDVFFSHGISILINTKFITIFSILFGVGFALQHQKATTKGVNFKAYFLRRMILLLLIGCIHAYLFWYGDIIRYYALVGILLALLPDWSAKTFLRLGVLFSVLLTASFFIIEGMVLTSGEPSIYPDQIIEQFANGSYLEVLRVNWLIDPIHNFVQDSILTFLSVIGKIFLGVWIGKIGLLSQPNKFITLRKKWMLWGLIMGVPGSITFWAINRGYFELSELWMLWIPFAVALGLLINSFLYISLFMNWFLKNPSNKIMKSFQNVGRLALTNYILQSIIGLFLFYGFLPGPNLMGKVGAFPLFLIAISIFTIQAIFSNWWLSKYAYGPIEYVWRMLSYGTSFTRNKHAN